MAFSASRLDEIGRPAWIAITIATFWLWWPLGLAVLAYCAFGRRRGRGMNRGQWRFPDMMGRCASGFSYAPPSGNRAFDEYRSETLRRLEDEQKEFVEYLDRLRQARDKQEFDQFMADRRQRPARTEDFNQPS
ncbi:DUF2852 domain-containing protein [Acidisphaera sp. L21]|uniref:DUF2852 domain-containing protein n=1 Tax=Acidisphaera sp. L21 TaxID=1641851 RepID=UPI00131D41A3|nr:DUF2852 domain-containing protein [Acidisphaera sp. L21]